MYVLHTAFLFLLVASGLAEFTSWRKLSPTGTAPQSRMRHKVLSYGQTFVFFGGLTTINNADHFYDDIWRLNFTDPQNLQWENLLGTTKIPNLGRSDHGLSYDAVTNNIYVFGGEISDFTLPTNFLSYSLPTQQWTQLLATAPLQGRLGHSTVFTKDVALVFGGTEADGTVLNELWGFYFKNKTWVQLNPSGALPPVRMWHAATLVNADVMIIYGGSSWQQAKTYYGDMWSYSISQNAWKEISTTYPVSVGTRKGGAGVGCNGKMYVFGGAVQDQNCLNNFWVFNYGANTWSNITVSGSQQPNEGYCSTKAALLTVNGNNYYVMFGGCTDGCKTIVGDLWAAQIQC